MGPSEDAARRGAEYRGFVARIRPVFAWISEHPFQADAVLAAALAVIALVSEWAAGEYWAGVHWRHPDALAVVLALALTVPLAWRRQHPAEVLTIVGIATVLIYAASFPPVFVGNPLLLAFYSAIVHRRRQGVLGAVLFTVVVICADLIMARGHRRAVDLFGNVVVFALAWIIGDIIRSRRAYTASLRERAERLEAEQALTARQAVSDERTRIARELHDVVAHSMSVMVVQAGAARRVIDADPAQAREALQSIEETGRQALDEMRRLVGVLRHDDEVAASRWPQPTVEHLDLLLDSLREAGLDVRLTIEGQPQPLPTGVELSAFRIVQEALTNTLKHAGPADAQVVLRWDRDALDVEISDDGQGPTDSGDPVPGHGLVGMRERVALFGGTLQAGARPGGGFRVRARFPLVPRPAHADR
jgi:signal transduction histidine kinase